MKLFRLCALMLSALLALPATSVFADDAPATADQAVIDATLSNFQSVKSNLHVLSVSHSASFGVYASQLDRAALRLENLPLLNVDSELVDYAFDAATRLRNVAQMYRDIGMRASIFDRTYTDCFHEEAWSFWSYYFSYWCSTYVDHTERQVATRDAVGFRALQSSELHSGFADLRRRLTLRYGVEFR